MDDCPRHLSLGTNIRYIVTVRDEDIEISLDLIEVISYFNSHQPTKREIKECRHFKHTSPLPWGPNSIDFEQDEMNYINYHPGDPINTFKIATFARGNEVKGVLGSVEAVLSEHFLEGEVVKIASMETIDKKDLLMPENWQENRV